MIKVQHRPGGSRRFFRDESPRAFARSSARETSSVRDTLPAVANIYETGLDKNAANFVPLSPLSLLQRTESVFPERLAVIHGDVRRTWKETAGRARRLSSALSASGIGKGDTVAALLPNVPAMLEAHFGVLNTGAILNTINTRLDAAAIGFILGHGEAKVLLHDRAFSETVQDALATLPSNARPELVTVDDPEDDSGEMLGVDYETFIADGDPSTPYRLPDDEWDASALNYTSGTTGNPKGVVYSHRGAYLNAIGNIVTWGMPRHAVYLWTLPMFHCNGWCFPWTVTALAGTHVCARAVRPQAIFEAIADHGVTHFCCAPTVMNMLLEVDDRPDLPHRVEIMTAGAAPPAAVIEGIEDLGFAITHAYGLTETYGPSAVCEWKSVWDELTSAERAKMKARQGVPYVVQESMTVVDAETMEQVPRDGATMGEIVYRGNITMRGYLKNPSATDKAFEGGVFHTGDLAVLHADDYVEIRDRAKDVIISGGENISTIEVEATLFEHPAVLEAAVVARPDEKWGETPCAFVTLRPGRQATAEDIIAFCRARIAHFKCPKTVVFTELPKTSTGKVQKYVLRDRARGL